MTIRSITLAAAAATIIGTPMLGLAANSPVALDSCVKAFMTQLSASKTGGFKLTDAHYASSGVADSNLLLLGGNSELLLTAHDAHDNHAVARAVCTVNSHGEVLDLHPTSLTGMEAY